MTLPIPANIASALRTCLSAIGQRLDDADAATAALAETVGQAASPAQPVAIELYEFTLDFAQVAAMGASTTGALSLGDLPAGCFVLTLTSTVTTPFVSSVATYNILLNVALRSTGHDTTVDADPYDEAGKIQHYIGSDTHAPYPDGADPDYGVINAVEVSAFGFNLTDAPARRNYTPTVRVTVSNTGGGAGTLNTVTAGALTLRYVVIRPFGT